MYLLYLYDLMSCQRVLKIIVKEINFIFDIKKYDIKFS